MPACAPGPGRTPRSCCWADACAARSSKSVLHSRRGMCIVAQRGRWVREGTPADAQNRDFIVRIASQFILAPC